MQLQGDVYVIKAARHDGFDVSMSCSSSSSGGSSSLQSLYDAIFDD